MFQFYLNTQLSGMHDTNPMRIKPNFIGAAEKNRTTALRLAVEMGAAIEES
jgi:hypothetical protein